MGKDVQQLCSRSVLFYLNGVYAILCYPNAVLEGSCTLDLVGDVCAFACWCMCADVGFVTVPQVFVMHLKPLHLTDRNETKTLYFKLKKRLHVTTIFLANTYIQ